MKPRDQETDVENITRVLDAEFAAATLLVTTVTMLCVWYGSEATP